VRAQGETLRREIPVADPAREAAGRPATLQVCRYVVRSRTLRSVIGEFDIGVPIGDLKRHAVEALRRNEFMAYTISLPDRFDTDELCFVPQGQWCDILSIRTNGWRRQHGDHRRDLNEILSDLAAAVACAKLRILSAEELEIERGRGLDLLETQVDDAAALASVRRAIDDVLLEGGLTQTERAAFVLGVSEAASNMLVHGGGGGTLGVRRLDDRVRAVVADDGPGLNFENWMGPPPKDGQASMGYGLKIVLDNLDTVGLNSSESGTTLLLDHMTT